MQGQPAMTTAEAWRRVARLAAEPPTRRRARLCHYRQVIASRSMRDRCVWRSARGLQKANRQEQNSQILGSNAFPSTWARCSDWSRPGGFRPCRCDPPELVRKRGFIIITFEPDRRTRWALTVRLVELYLSMKIVSDGDT